MKTIHDVLDGMRAAAGKADEERGVHAAEIRRRIEEGESTGDAILDFLVWMWPTDHEQALPHYRALAERLKGRTGEFILMIERREDSGGGCVVSFGPPVEETFTLGVLVDDRLKLERVGEGFSRGRLSFPTERYASNDGSRIRRGGLQDGDVKPWIYDTLFFAKIRQPMEIHHRDRGGCFGGGGTSVDFCLGADRETPFSELEFHVGDAEIDAWCRRGAMHYPKDAPNENRCELILGLARLLGSDARKLPAVEQAIADAGAKLLKEIEKRVEDLRAAKTELEGEKDPRNPADLVKRLRETRQEIRSLLARAAELGFETPFIQRLRAAHSDPA